MHLLIGSLFVWFSFCFTSSLNVNIDRLIKLIRDVQGFFLLALAEPGQAHCISTKSIIYFCNKPITLGLLQASVSNHLVFNTNFICASGVVKDHNAGYIQWATELSAATYRVYGAYIPHPQSQLTFQHNWANAGTSSVVICASSWWMRWDFFLHSLIVGGTAVICCMSDSLIH